MKRRAFLGRLGGATLGVVAHGCTAADAARARLTVASEDAGRPIAPDFIGLSYESSIVAPGDYFTPDNRSVLGLIRSLGDTGVIRIGGNKSEHTVWRPDARPSASDSFALTPTAIDRLATALRILGWRLIWGLNLARGTPEAAAEEAAYVAHAVGPHLLAFQIGNEPDGFGLWTKVRPPSYDADAFVAEWRRFHAAVRARVPEARFAGPAVSFRTDWVARLADAKPERLALLTHHYYADGPSGALHVSLAKLLHTSDKPAATLATLEDQGRLYHLPYRIAETNSVYNEGQPGVSDTLGAALWAVELMFQIAAAGGAGVNFHAGIHNHRADADKAYTPIARAGGGRHRAAPLYYGMLMFAQAARGALLPARLAAPSPELRAFAVRAPDGTLRVCLINKGVDRGARVGIDPGRQFARAAVLSLAGPAPDARTGVTLGGATVDEFGAWTPSAHEVTRFAGREIIVDVPAASAAVVSVT